MVGKRKAAPPKTLLRGKYLKRENKNLKKVEPTKEIEIIISPELKHNNIGDYQKDGKKKKITKNGDTSKEKIYGEPINHNGMGDIKEESKQKKTALSFSIKEN